MYRPVQESPSEMSFGGGITDNEETNIVNTQISERTEVEGTVPLFQILFIEGGWRGICGGQLWVEQDYACRWC